MHYKLHKGRTGKIISITGKGYLDSKAKDRKNCTQTMAVTREGVRGLRLETPKSCHVCARIEQVHPVARRSRLLTVRTAQAPASDAPHGDRQRGSDSKAGTSNGATCRAAHGPGWGLRGHQIMLVLQKDVINTLNILTGYNQQPRAHTDADNEQVSEGTKNSSRSQ